MLRMKGKIYKIHFENIVYVGSTTKTLNRRFSSHKCDFKNKTGKYSIHKYFKEFGIEKFTIELIVDIEVENRKQLYDIEYQYIQSMECVNKLKYNNRKESNKNYRLKNTEKIKEYSKNYYEKNKEILNKQNRERWKEYYKINKKSISSHLKKKVKCDICDKEYHKKSLTRHKNTMH